MKRIIIALSLLVFFTGYTKLANAQYYFYNDTYYDSPLLFEIGGSLGPINCLTDLGGRKGVGEKYWKDLNTGKTQFQGGIYVTAMYQYAIGLRLEGMFGKIVADDAALVNVDPKDIARTRYNRNVNFRTSLAEISLVAELHPLFMFIDYSERDEDPPRLSPYLLGGVGYYSFNPQAKLGNKWVDLQPLSTEGQGLVEYPDKPMYELKQFNFPVGAGLKYELSDLLNLRGEFVYRVLKTDYLDDVSTTYVDPAAYANPANGMSPANQALAFQLSDRQINKVTGPGGKRGSPAQRDSYFSINIKLGLYIGRERIR